MPNESSIKNPSVEEPSVKKPVKSNALSMKVLLAKIEEQAAALAEVTKKLEDKSRFDKKEVIPAIEVEPKKEKIVLKVNEDLEAKKERLRLKDRELVVGTFRDHERKGGHVKFDFKKWDKDPIEKFLLLDGHRYAIPRGVATHLRDNCKYKTYPGSNLLGETIKREATISNRYAFERDDFDDETIDISSLPNGYAPKDVIY